VWPLRWSEQQWLQGWAVISQRYANVSTVVGVGLRNEPRPTFISESLNEFRFSFVPLAGLADRPAAAGQRSAPGTPRSPLLVFALRMPQHLVRLLLLLLLLLILL
jgi:hypothetical protein